MTKKMKYHGMSMACSSGNGGGGSSGDNDDKEPNVPDTDEVETVEEEKEKSNPSEKLGDDFMENSLVFANPMPVVLTLGTIIKLASIIVIPLIGMISTGIYFFHKTNLHMDNIIIHLSKGERGRLETKLEAATARKSLQKSITRELKVRTRELKQELGDQQKDQFNRLGKELKKDQKQRFDLIIQEVKKYHNKSD